jgi:hypothetical protein
MKKSATTRTVRRTVEPREHRLTCMRMRLHLPRRRARHELPELMLGDGVIDDTDDAATATPRPEAELQA